MTFDPAAKTAVVFSHPNHELAIFGFLQTCRPWLVYLTDGGGEDRVEQTRQGLRRIGLLDRAKFLNFTEQSFYDGLLECDSAFYAEVTARLGAALHDIQPEQVLCDAVEFYNPVHDMSLPLVRAALRGLPTVKVFEIPLVYEKPAKEETYEIQRPASPAGQPIEFSIADSFVEQKARARDEVYTILTAQLGSLITDIPSSYLAKEVIVPAHEELVAPHPAQVLRYERRAQLLLEAGAIARKITYQGNYVPVAAPLLRMQV